MLLEESISNVLSEYSCQDCAKVQADLNTGWVHMSGDIFSDVATHINFDVSEEQGPNAICGSNQSL